MAVCAVLAAATLTACGGRAAGDQQAARIPASAAIPLDRPFAKPDIVLTDTHGKPYRLAEETTGTLTLLYFGYTHCPDVCPTTMSDLAAAKRTLPAAERDQVRVVFISTDPQRDTPRRLAAWLGAQDPSFIGLTGDFGVIQAAARSLGVVVEKPVREKDGSISVTHGAEVLAFSPEDNTAHVLYTSGVTAQQYAADLPKLLQGETP